MKRLWLAALALALPGRFGAAEPAFRLPAFPRPELVTNDFGEAKEIGFLAFLRELQDGGVSGLDDVDFVDESYAVIASHSLVRLSAWLEATCQTLGIELAQARRGAYDGMVYARLLEVATSLAAMHKGAPPLAMPIGVVLCQRRRPWGDLPGDGARDAYMIIATDRGLLIYDPPTRQLTPLADFPNNTAVFKIQF